MLDAERQTVIHRTRNWVEQIIIGLNLCPFAGKVFRTDQIRFAVSEASNPESLLQALDQELDHLLDASPEKVDTTLLIHPFVLEDFLEYWDFISITEVLLEEKGLEGIIQIATFHPDYRFSETSPDSAANYSNRSPYPMLHLLREDSVSLAIDNHPDIEEIPKRNIEYLNSLGREYLDQLRNRLME